jgi:hypothetical protein
MKLTIRLHANETFETREAAEAYAATWLDRIAERDEPYTWDSCDWEVSE